MPSHNSSAPLWRRFFKERTTANRNALVTFYWPMVRPIAEAVHRTLVDYVRLEDLMSAGAVGLIASVEAFRLDRGAKFETFSYARIRGAMLDELRALDWVPRLVHTRNKSVANAKRAFWDRHGRYPSEVELASQLQMTVGAMRRMLHKDRLVAVTSLDKKKSAPNQETAWSDPDDWYAFLSRSSDRAPDHRESIEEFWREVTRGMQRQMRLAVLLYYRMGRTMKDAGAECGMSESRISQILTQACAHIKKCRDSVDLHDILKQTG